VELPGLPVEDLLQHIETRAGAAIVRFERERRVDLERGVGGSES
jgi:hypothetical protein